MTSYAYLFKYIIIGDSSVGQSCILAQFLDGKFQIDHDTTIGVQFGSQIIKADAQRYVKLQVWDTAGQESFKSITRSYYRGSICAILVYDVTSRQSFENLSKWLQDTQNYANEQLTIMVVGNQTDLSSKRTVSYDEGLTFANKNELLFMEASAQTAYNIEAIFQQSSEDIVQKIMNKTVDPTNESLGVKLGSQMSQQQINEDKQQQSGQCC